MKSDETGYCLEGRQQTCNITVSDDDFWVPIHSIVVQLVKYPGSTVSATGTQDASNVRIIECLVEIRDPVGIITGKTAMAGKKMIAKPYPKPGIFKKTDPLIQFIRIRGAGGCNDFNCLTGF